MSHAADKLGQPGFTLSAFVTDRLSEKQIDEIRHTLMREGIFLGFEMTILRKEGLLLSADHELRSVSAALAVLEDEPGFGAKGTLNAFQIELDELIVSILDRQT